LTLEPTTIIVTVVLCFAGLITLLWLLDTYSTKKILKSYPELLKTKIEHEKARTELEKKKRVEAPVLVPKTVDVIVVREGETLLHDKCRFTGDVILCKGIGMEFTVPSSYKPYISLERGKKMKVVFFFNEQGEAIKWELKEYKPSGVAPDPRMSSIIHGRRLLLQIFRTMWGLDTASLFAGVGLGAFAIVLIVFFILPIMGYPVTIGKTPVEVRITQTASGTLPPPGNYTVPIR